MKTKKDLIDLIKKHKKNNCPAYSNKKKDELLKIVNNLNLKKSEVKKPEVKKPTVKKETIKKPEVKKPTVKKESKEKLNKKEQDFINKKDKIKKSINKITSAKNFKQYKEQPKIDKLEEELDDVIKKEKEYYRKKFGD